MSITYTVAVDLNDDGDFSDLGEAISADVLALRWRLGMARPYDTVAAPIEARITVRNRAGAYSPERSANNLAPGKPLRIQSDDGATTRTHFSGFISHIEPLPGDQGRRTAILHAHGPERQLQQPLRLPPQINVTADAVIAAALDAVPLRRAVLAGRWIVGVQFHTELDSSTRLAEPTISRSLETGKSTLAYVGDTWAEGIPALEAIRQVAEAERGRFFINREGAAVFYHRHHTLLESASAASFTDDMDGLAYVYGQDVVSGVQARVTPRSIGPAGTPLWTLESAQELPPRQDAPREIVARFRDASGRPIGALEVAHPVRFSDYTANTREDGSGVDKTALVDVVLLAAEASAARLRIVNRSGQRVYLLAGAALRGTPLYQGDPLSVEQHDAYSQAFYGPGTLVFDLPALTSLEEADSLARFELARRKDPRGAIRTMQINARLHPTQALARTLFDRIAISESQTGHAFDYFIIAEDHHVERGGARHSVAWLLENVGFSRFFIVGSGQLDQTTPLAY